MKVTARPRSHYGETLNYSTPDIGELATSKPKMVAYCTSSHCTNNLHAMIEVKNISIRVDMCPNCGHFLVWKKPDSRYDRRNK